MTNKELSEYYGVCKSAVSMWSKAKKHRKTIEAEAGAEPKVASIVAELQRLAYVYNCQQYRADKAIGLCYVSVANVLVDVALFDLENQSMDPFKSYSAELDNIEQLNNLLSTMEELVYGTPQVV